MDTVILIKLIINELITDPVKCAFQEKDGGKISIVKRKGENKGGTSFGTMLVKL